MQLFSGKVNNLNRKQLTILNHIKVNKFKIFYCHLYSLKGNVLAIRTSSQRLAAVRKREAMLLASVYSRSFCLNRDSYLYKRKITDEHNGNNFSLINI